jgi:hypothetical protein
LVYERQDGGDLCPDETEVRAGVTTRLGYDAFDVAAEQVQVLKICSSPRALQPFSQATPAQPVRRRC